MCKGKIIALLLFVPLVIFGQVGAGIGFNDRAIEPSAILEIEADDKGVLLPGIALQGTKDENTITSPAFGLLIYNISDAPGGAVLGDAVKADNYYYWTGESWSLLLDTDGMREEIEKLRIPQCAIYTLKQDMSNFLNGVSPGVRLSTPMTEVINGISDYVSFNESTNELTIAPGVYTMQYIYSAEHQGCTISSYIVDFPAIVQYLRRIHSTAQHGSGSNNSHHGGVITCSYSISVSKTWQISLGRGQSGNCTGLYGILKANGTHLILTRYGNN